MCSRGPGSQPSVEQAVKTELDVTVGIRTARAEGSRAKDQEAFEGRRDHEVELTNSP